MRNPNTLIIREIYAKCGGHPIRTNAAPHIGNNQQIGRIIRLDSLHTSAKDAPNGAQMGGQMGEQSSPAQFE